MCYKMPNIQYVFSGVADCISFNLSFNEKCDICKGCKGK